MLCAISAPMCSTRTSGFSLPRKPSDPLVKSDKTQLSFFSQESISHTRISVRAATSSSSEVGNAEFMKEPATNVKFQGSLTLPGCSSSLSLLGTGYREKVFAIVGVKVYAAGLYIDLSILNVLDDWKGQSPSQIQANNSLFKSIFEAPLEKALQIVLVRDIDGKTFWDALDDAITPRIEAPDSLDELALSTLRRIFKGRALKKGTFIFLTWLDPSKMLVFISQDGMPTDVEATIQSTNVAFAVYDVFLGDSPISPSLKSSISSGLAQFLNN